MKYAFWPYPLNTGKQMKKMIRFIISSMISMIIFHIIAVQSSAATLQWDTNDEADYYVVHYGTESGSYEFKSSPIYDTQIPIETQGTRDEGDVVVVDTENTWYLTVKGFNECGNSTNLSEEIVYVASGSEPVDPLSVTIQSPALSVTINEGGSIQFLGTVSGGTSPYDYTWTFGDGGPSDSDQEDPGEVTFPTEGTYDVVFTATDSNGTSESDTVTITVDPVYENLTPVAAISSPSSSVTIDEGQSVTFSATVTSGNAPFTHNWAFGDNGPASQNVEDPGSVTFPTAGEYLVTYTVTDDDGETDSDTVLITVEEVYVNVVLSAYISKPTTDVTITEGASVLFGAHISSGNAPYANSWTFGTGGPSALSVEDPGYVTFPTAGTYTVVYTVTDNDGETVSDSVTVTVNELYEDVQPTATITSPSSAMTINEGESVTFEGSVTSGNAPFTHSWSFGDNGPAGQNVEDPGSVTFPTAGTYTVTYTVADNEGDSDSDTVVVTVKEVYVNETPTANITKPTTSVTINEGESVTFEGSVTSGNAPFAHAWTFGTGGPSGVSVEDPGSVTFPTAGTYTVTYTVTDNDGETDSDTVTVTVNVVYVDLQPTASISSPSSAVAINEGEAVTFGGSVSDGNAPFTHAWTFGTGGPSGVSVKDPGSVTFPTAGTYTVTYTVTDNDGDTDSASVVVTVKEVYVNETPSAYITKPASAVTITEGETVLFGANVTSGNAPFTHSWTFGTGGPSGLSVEDPGYVTFPTAGTYTVTYTVTDNDGETDSDSRLITVNAAYVNSTPLASITSPSGSVTITEGESVNFEAGVSGGNEPMSYDWSFGDNGPAGESVEDPGSVTFPDAGSFTVTFTVTDNDGETGTVSILVQVETTTTTTTTTTETTSLTPVLTADLDGTVQEVHWQISTDSEFRDVVLNVKVKDSLTLQVPDLVLNAGVEYYSRYRNKTPKAIDSDWSETSSFLTESTTWADDDGNGIPDDQEAPTGLDLNKDGVADETQPDTILCIKTLLGDSVVGLVKTEGVVDIEMLESVDYTTITNTTNMPDEMPSGMIGFRIVVDTPGDTVEMGVCFSEPIPEGAAWYKYDSVTGWQDFTANTIVSDDRMMITVTLTDGGLGDSDGSINGVIVDPSGIGLNYDMPDNTIAIPDEAQSCFIGSVDPDRQSIPWVWFLVPVLAGGLFGCIRRENA